MAETEAPAVGCGRLPAVQSDPSSGQSPVEMKSEQITDATADPGLPLCVCMAAEGLSRGRGGADGWSDHDLGAAPAGSKRAIPGRRSEGAGKE